MHQDSHSPDTSGDERAQELEQLRERLSFYESFDQLIQDNISRAGELLREAAARKSETEVALRRETEQIQQSQLAERVNYRRVFSSLLDEITMVQQNVERLARQVADALDDLEAVIPAQGEAAALEGESFPTMPRFSGSVAGELESGTDSTGEGWQHLVADPADVRLAPEEEHVQEPVDELVTGDEAVQETTDFGTVPAATPGLTGQSGFQEVVQASVERVSAEMGASEAPEHDDSGSHGISVDISGEDGSYSVYSLDAEEDEPAADDGGQGEFTAESVGLIGDTVESDMADVQADPGHETDDVGEADQVANVSADAFADAPASDDRREVSGADAATGLQAPDYGEDTWLDESPAAATTVLVHGVPRATTALSLKRYLEGLEQVHAVEPREYAEGVLRLQVSSDRPVGIDDLRGWPDASGMVPVDVRDDFLEVRLGQ